MYATEGALPAETVPRGTRLLGVSPPVLGLRGVGYRLLARGLDDGEGAVVVSVDRGAGHVGESIAELTASDDALERLAVVDATGQGGPRGAPPFGVEAVSSPGDLTGIGVSVTRALETLVGRGVEGVRLVVDSLSSLLIYTEFGAVYRFAHTVGARIQEIGGLGLFLVNADTDEGPAEQFGSLVEGTLELREGDAGPEWRLRGLGTGDEWAPYDPTETTWAASGDRGATAADDPVEVSDVTSLHDLIEAVSGARYTLTVCNHTGDTAQVEELRSYFDGLGVDVRTAELSTPTPVEAAILHRGGEPVAMSPLDELLDAVRFEGDTLTAEREVRPELLERAHRQRYTVENGGKLRMVRISRLVETRALEVGEGTLHAGFQRLDRVEDELGTRQLYERIAASDVDVHVYGRPGAVPNQHLYTVHDEETPELADSWFVVYDGAGRDEAAGALVSEETGPDEYSGFWTYRPEIVRAADGYLRSRYGAASG